MTIKALYRYPVKSLARESLSSARLTEYGIEYDRCWMIVDETDSFMTQRELPTLALLSAKVVEGKCVIFKTQDQEDQFGFDVNSLSDTLIHTNVWKSKVIANEVSAEASQWLSDTLGKKLRIVTSGKSFRRSKSIPGKTLKLRFSDGYPILVLSQASVDMLNEKLVQPVDEARFRANILIDGVKAHAEDNSVKLTTPKAEIRLIKPCKRCIMINTNQLTAEVSSEPLKTLTSYRKVANHIHFGMNAFASKFGELNVNEKIELSQE